MPSRYLVTGGAGFVGSHLILALADRGDRVVVIDAPRTGHRGAVPRGVRLIEGNAGDAAVLAASSAWIMRGTGWTPRYAGLDAMAAAYARRHDNPGGCGAR